MVHSIQKISLHFIYIKKEIKKRKKRKKGKKERKENVTYKKWRTLNP